ncbi:MAG TPA: hypothetical protein VG845_13670 [Dehalococcoidia bacterium]|jgi:hypothetical protein|nr:hypothetical protein [Dehalococcoidia bacterium]
MTKLRWFLTPLAAVLIGLSVIACGGDKDSDSAGSSGSGSSVSSELDLSNAANELMELRSFRFDMALKLDFDLGSMSEEDDEFGAEFAAAFLALLSDVRMEGAYVAPDTFDIKMKLAGEEVHMIQIGDRAWINEGSGWTETDPETGLGFLGDPSELAFEMLPQEILRNAKTSKDKVNGQDTTHYSFDKQALEAIVSDLGEDMAELAKLESAKLDAWVTEDNIPVKVALDVKGQDEDGAKMAISMDFNVTDLNSDKIKIEAPI